MVTLQCNCVEFNCLRSCKHTKGMILLSSEMLAGMASHIIELEKIITEIREEAL